MSVKNGMNSQTRLMKKPMEMEEAAAKNTASA